MNLNVFIMKGAIMSLDKILIILILLTCIISASIWFKNRVYKITILLYLIFQSSIIFISMFNPLGLYDVSTKTYIILMINVIMTLIGFACAVKIVKYNNNLIYENSKGYNFEKSIFLGDDIKLNWFVWLTIITAIILFYYAFKFNKVALNDVVGSRMARFSVGPLFKSLEEIYLYNWIITPLVSIYNCIIAYKLINNSFKDKTFILCSINVILYFMVGYGRQTILELIIYTVICYFVFKKRKKIALKSKILCLLGICILLFGGIYITAKRLGMIGFDMKIMNESLEVFMKQIVTYFTGSIRALEYGINTFFGEYLYEFGRLTFGGLDEIIGTILNYFGINYTLANSIGSLTQAEIFIGEGIKHNALYTANLAYFIDFGYIGIIIFPFLIGVFTAMTTKKFLEYKDEYSLFIYLFSVYCLILTSMKCAFQSSDTWVLLIMCYLLSKFSKRKFKIKW